jgi:spore maturation protein CgeB
MSVYFHQPLVDMGHEVFLYDHVASSQRWGRERATSGLLSVVARADPDVVLYQTLGGREPIFTEQLRDISRDRCVIAWNSDDDWQAERTLPLAPDFTWMVTTSQRVFMTARERVPNLLLSQWACYEKLGVPGEQRFDFTFAGSVYGQRLSAVRYLREAANLQVFGRGSRLVNLRLPYVRGVFRLTWLSGRPLSFSGVHGVWNSSRLSFCPQETSADAMVKQIKGRLFEMGSSGTVPLCNYAPGLEDYYDLEAELCVYSTLEDCAEKAQRLLRDHRERDDLARAYRRRTLADHLWRHRFTKLFSAAGVESR